MVVAAVMILLFLSLTALAIDYGMIKTAKAEAQRAMDGAALAGASAFTEPDPTFNKDSGAKARAKALAVKHTVRRTVIDTTAAHMTVTVDLANSNVTATYSVPPMSLWFGRRFGTSTMGLTATAKAHAENTNTATCVKPVAIPDAFNNQPNISKGKEQEDLNGDKIYNYKDGNSNSTWDEGETEPWSFDNSKGDSYDSTSTGWGTNYRNALGTGVNRRTKDYGRQILVQPISSKDLSTPSWHNVWGKSKPDANSASKVAARILGECETAEVQTTYEAGNGSNTGPVSDAWDELIARDPGATWVDNPDPSTGGTVTGSNQGANWLNQSARVIVVGLYNPSAYAGCPSCNTVQLNNLGRVFLEPHTCKKCPVTGRFLGLVGGGGAGGNPSGSLVKRLVLIK
jgi:hypothetical protein